MNSFELELEKELEKLKKKKNETITTQTPVTTFEDQVSLELDSLKRTGKNAGTDTGRYKDFSVSTTDEIAPVKQYNFSFSSTDNVFDISSNQKMYDQMSGLLNQASEISKKIIAIDNRPKYGALAQDDRYWNSEREKLQTELDTLVSGYGSLNNLRTQTQTLGQQLKLANYQQKGSQLASVADANSANFDKNFLKYTQADKSVKDDLYAFVNNINDAQKVTHSVAQHYNNAQPIQSTPYGALASAPVAQETNTGADGNTYAGKGYHLLSEDEKAVFNYYWAKEGKEKAVEWLDSLQLTLNERLADQNVTNIGDSVTKKLLYGVQAGFNQFTSGLDSAANAAKGAEEFTVPNVIQITSSKLREDMSGIGKVAYDLTTSTANMLPSILASSAANFLVPGSGAVVGAATMGTSAGGNAYQEMINQGYDANQARAYGALVGGSEAVLQYALGGITKLAGGNGGVFDSLVKKALPSVENGLVRFALKYGGNMLDEGLEEAVQEVLDPVFQRMVGNPDAETDWGEVAYSALLGALSAGVLESGSVPKAVKAYKNGIDPVSGLSSNDKKVVDKVYNDLIAEEEKNGKVSQKRKDEIYDDLIEQLDKGGISTETIEEVLGGDNYKAYQDTIKQENESLAELAELYEGDELKQKTEEFMANSKRTEMAKNLSDSVYEMVKDSRLGESYRDRARRGQQYEADVSKYDEKQRVTVQKAIDSGVLNNSNRTHDMVDFIAKVSSDTGVLFDFTNNEKLKDSIFAVNGKTVDGYITEDGITINVNSPRYINSIVGHEITHALEGTELYEALESAAFEYAKEKGNYKDVLKAAYDMYSGLDGYKGAEGLKKIKKEAVANLVGDYLFTDKDFVKSLSTKNRNVFQKIYDEIKYMVKVARAGSNEAKKLLEVQKAFEEAYRNGGKTPSGTKHSLSETTDGRFAAVVDNDILSNIDTSSWDDNKKDEAKKAAVDALKQFSDGIVVNGITAKVNRDSRREYTRSEYTERLYRKSPDVFADKMRVAEIADDIVVAATNWNRDGGLKHPRKDNFVDFDHGETLIVSGNSKYIAEVVVGITDTGDAVFYDVVDMTPTTFDIKKEESPSTATTQNAIGDILGDSSGVNLAQKAPVVKGQFSLSEDSKKLNDVGLSYDAKNETVSYSLSSLENAFDYNKSEADYLASRLEYETALAKSIAEDKENVTEEEMAKAKRYLDSLFLIHDMIAADSERLDYEAAVGKSAWVSNAEYGGSIDFSTLCAKRRLFTGTFDAIQNQMPDTVLNENDFLQIRNMLLEKELESPCSMCYVEGSRAKHGVYVAKFLKDYKQTNPEWMPQIADFTSTTRLEQTRINHPEAYKAYVDAMNKLSQRKPKEASVRTDYRGEILRDFKDTSTVAEKNKNGGVRFNSFSDFEIIHAIDCMQVLTDMARVGLNGQAYTKVKEFAEAFGNTGLKINLSLVAKDVDANGNLIMDETNGMKYDEAMDLRNRYSDNVGTVIVVFNEAQLKAALADNSIDYVLPFHRSQWKKSQYTMMGLPTNTKDFTNFQNDRIKNPKTGRDVKLSKIKHTSQYTNDITGESFEITDNIMPNQYWDFNVDGRANAQRYLDYINSNGMTPKFSFLLDQVDGKWVLPNDAVGDGYFKVLIDFKMYNNDGWGSPQNPVVPEFNMPYIQQMLENYKGGHQSFPVAHDVVSEFVEGKKNGKFSLSNEDAQPVKQGNWHISGKDVAYGDIAPVAETAPVAASQEVAEVPVQDLFPDDFKSDHEELDNLYMEQDDIRSSLESATAVGDYNTMSMLAKKYDEVSTRIRELEAQGEDRFNSISDADVPPEMETEQYGEADTTPLNKKTVTDLTRKVKSMLGIKNNRTGEVVSMIEAYSRNKNASGEQLFEELKAKFGKYTDKVADDATKEVKALLRSYRINVSDSIKSEIADYSDLMRRNFGRVRFSKEGLAVDEVYEDLQSSYPGYFPESIINPTDQLMQIINVANMEAETVTEITVDDETLADAARTIARTVKAYQQNQMQALANSEAKTAFDSLMKSADDVAPAADDDIAPVVKQKEKTAKIEKPATIAPDQQIKTVKERLAVKMQALETELENNRKLREESWADYDNEIQRAKAEYNSKSNKNTVAANDLLRRIERLNRMKSKTDAEYAKRISDLETKTKNVAEEFRTGESASEQGAMRQELHSRIMSDIKTRFEEKGFDFDNVLTNAKNLSTFATVDNTPQRVMEKALGYKAGQVLSDLTVNKVAQNETEGIKWLNSYTDRKNGLLAQISKQYKIKPGSKESAAAQMYAEGFYVNGKNEIVEYGDAELAQDFPNAKVRENIKKLAVDPRIRKIYDETLEMINASRARNAYPEIMKLDNYFLHFRAMDDTFSRLGIPFNPNDIKAKDLPTDLNGVTADLKPGQPYFASAMHRTGKRTSFDLLGGLERYLSSAKNQIYHIDDIQTLRALRNYVADTYGQAKGLKDLDLLTEEEAQERIKQVYDSHLSTFAKFLNEEANVIAGKTALIDRGLEGILGRRGMTFLDTVNRQVGSNMVGFNVSSSLTNFLPVAQTLAKTAKRDFFKAFTQTVSNKIGTVFGKNDGFTENSPVFIRRQGEERFYRTPFQKVADTGYMLMGAVDNISTELIARTKYNELTRKGMDSAQAHIETDKWVSRLMGDRSLGQQPQLYNSKMLGIITKFQLEVRNQLDSQFYDTIQEAKVSNEDIKNVLARNAKTAAKVTSTFFQLAVAQHLFGKAFESVAGYNPAFDIISVLIKAIGWDDEEDSEDTVLDNIEEGFLELLEDLPYTSSLTGGRIPISSALPIEELVKGKDQYGNEKSRWVTLAETLPYYILPGGYGQVKKTYQGLDMFSDEHPVSGSYTNSGNLRFPVEDTPLNRIQAGMFGQYASQNARDYFDNERSPLNEKQIQEYIDVDLPIRDYWEYREGLKGLKTLDEKGDYIGGLDLPIDKKNVLINNIADRKDPIDMTHYSSFENFKEFDYGIQNPAKYKFLQEHGLNYEEYEALDSETKEAYTWAFKNPEAYAVSKMVTKSLVKYRRYTKALSEIKADKDKNGKSISGSRKEKVIEYLNNLNADYWQKIILFKSEYPADDTYNNEIVEYLNGMDDITYEEKVTILKELGFTVLADGTVRWD